MARQVKGTGQGPSGTPATVPAGPTIVLTPTEGVTPLVVQETPVVESSIANSPTTKPDAVQSTLSESPSPIPSKAAEAIFTVIYLLYKTNTITRYQLASMLKTITDSTIPDNLIAWLIQESKKA